MSGSRALVAIDDLVRRVHDLLTIGTALALPSWGDDLAAVKGIGPVFAEALRDQGVTTFAALAALDDLTRRRVVNSVSSVPADIDDWMRQAAELARFPLDQGAADDYLGLVQLCAGRPYDGSGLIGFVVRNSSNQAVPLIVDLFAAPPEHDRSVALAAALRDVVVDGGGWAYVPLMEERDLRWLRVIDRSLQEHGTLSDDLVDELGDIGDRIGFDFTGNAGG